MSRILVIGEALIDIIHTSDGRTTLKPGGGPANIALGLARLGAQVDLLTWLADDDNGDLLRTHLQKSGVRVDPASFGAARTPTAEVSLDDAGHASYRFDIRWDLPDRLQLNADWVHSGSIAAFLEPGAEKTYEALQAAAQRGAAVSVDPNIRPALIGDPQQARSQFERLAQLAAVVKLSDEDALWLYPRATESEVLTRMHRLGVKLAVITGGETGSVLSTADRSVRVPSTRVPVVDTIGAGDSYMAALIWPYPGATESEVLTRMHRLEVKLAVITGGETGSVLSTADRSVRVPSTRVPVVDTVGAGDSYMAALIWQLSARPEGLSWTTGRLTELGEVCSRAAAVTVGRLGADLPWFAELQPATAL